MLFCLPIYIKLIIFKNIHVFRTEQYKLIEKRFYLIYDQETTQKRRI